MTNPGHDWLLWILAGALAVLVLAVGFAFYHFVQQAHQFTI